MNIFTYKSSQVWRQSEQFEILGHLWQNQQNDCVPGEDSDQPWHLPSLIRVFAVHSMAS